MLYTMKYATVWNLLHIHGTYTVTLNYVQMCGPTELSPELTCFLNLLSKQINIMPKGSDENVCALSDFQSIN